MQKFTSWTGLDAASRGAAAAIGNFDGVHLGHREVIEIARRAAAERGVPLGIVTFEPHPREFFAPQAPGFRLMNAEAKAHRLEKLGVGLLYELPFGPELANLTAEGFTREVLHEGLGLSHVVVGQDFRFGKNRGGDAQGLSEMSRALGFETTVSPLIALPEGEVSSTSIRRALTAGEPETAARMLGHRHRIEGEVIHGEKRGRELGFPTANMGLERLHLPRFGVYAVEVEVLTGPHRGRYHGVSSIGVRPMFGENLPNLETYLFDFSGDLYGEHLSVGLEAFLRAEEKFDTLDALIAQMDADCARARAIVQG